MLSGILGQNDSFLTGLNNIESRIATTNQNITSGYRVNKPSDDPGAVSAILSYQSQIDHITQVQSNLNIASSDATAADSALQSATTLLDNISSLGSQGLTLSADAATRTILGKQVQIVQQQLVSIANTSVRGDYVFSGDSPAVSPYRSDLSGTNGVVSQTSAAATRVLTDAAGSTRLASLTASQIFDTRQPSTSNAVITDPGLTAAPALDSTAHSGIAQSFTFTLAGQAAPLTVMVNGTPGGYTTKASLLSAVQTAIDSSLAAGAPPLPSGTISAGVDNNTHLMFTSNNVSFVMTDNGTDDTAHDSPAGINAVGNPGADNIFAAVASLSVALQNNDTTGIQNAINSLKAGATHLQSSGAFYGNVESWISDSISNSSSQSANLSATLASLKDTDLASAATELTLNNTALQAAIQAHASLSNKTLFSYLG